MARTTGAYSKHSVAPGLQRAWQSMRIMRSFTCPDISTTAELQIRTVRIYMRALRRAGFVRLARRRAQTSPGSFDVWALVRDSGPQAPIARRDGSGVYDRNTGISWGSNGEPQA